MAIEAVVNDDTVRRQSRRETEPAARELAPPARKLVFYKRNTAALFFCFTRIAIIYPLFCCGRDIGLGCRLGRCFCFAEVSTGHPHPFPTTSR